MAYVLLALALFGLLLVWKGVIGLALFMLILLVFTGVVALLDKLVLRRMRAADAPEPVVVEYCKSFFPVILVVFVIRSFLVEPFKIPSGSMIPTLQVGDFILVNKFTYGLRIPVLNTVFYEVNHPQRGEVMVFHYPKDPSLDYIKRVIGVPGDRIAYRNKRLTINGVPLNVVADGRYQYGNPDLTQEDAERFQETLGTHTHAILNMADKMSVEGEVVVPEGQYFMMGDNRDNSNDSRYWGFVPEQNIVGRAFFVWMNFGDFSRIGTRID